MGNGPTEDGRVMGEIGALADDEAEDAGRWKNGSTVSEDFDARLGDRSSGGKSVMACRFDCTGSTSVEMV
jgi:hypothetical protein